MEKDFFETAASNDAAREHEQEIRNTRVGGLGGSDAAMILRIAERGLSALTATDNKRIAVMLGIVEPDNFGGNVWTNAGHAFEDFAEQNLPFGAYGYEREKVLEQELARNFRTFAHADFVTGENYATVIECKFVQKSTEKVEQEYYAQLQWYYMLCAQCVVLYHGQGTAEPFSVEEGKLQTIERDEETVRRLIKGINILDEAIGSGWRPVLQDKQLVIDTPQMVQEAFEELEAIKTEETALKERKEKASAVLKGYLEDWGLTGIVKAGEKKQQVIYVKGGFTKTFDTKKFLADNPEYNDKPEYWTSTRKSSSISFK